MRGIGGKQRKKGCPSEWQDNEIHSEHMKKRRSFFPCASFQAALLALPFLLPGCVGVLPFPELSSQPTHGTKLLAKDTAFIRVGTTSAAEVFGRLGTDCRCDPRERAVAFPWELPGGRGIWWIVCMEAGAGGEFEWSRWRAFFVAFNANNAVTAAGIQHLSSGKSLDEQLEAWAKKHHAAPGRLHPELVTVNSP